MGGGRRLDHKARSAEDFKEPWTDAALTADIIATPGLAR